MSRPVVCFDLWNTLIATSNPRSYTDILVDAGFDAAEIFQFVRDYMMVRPFTYDELFKILLKRFWVDTKLGKEIESAWRRDNETAQWIPGALSKLKKLSRVSSLVLISNVSSAGWEVVDRRLKIGEKFDRLFLSFEQRVNKPQEEVWQKVEQWYGDMPANQFVMVGDSVADDLTVPKKRGWQTYLAGNTRRCVFQKQ